MFERVMGIKMIEKDRKNKEKLQKKRCHKREREYHRSEIEVIGRVGGKTDED